IHPAALTAGQSPDERARLLLEPDRRDHLVDVSRVRVEPGEVPKLFPHGRIALLPAGLQHDADPGLPRQAAVLGIDAQHTRLTAGAVAVTLEDLDRRTLARSVRTEQGEGLAAPDLEVDAAQGLRAAIVL